MKTGKKFLVVGMCLSLLFVFSCSSGSEGGSPYKIGVNLELTGPWAEITKTVKMVMEMEVERINEMGGVDGHPLELIIEDN